MVRSHVDQGVPWVRNRRGRHLTPLPVKLHAPRTPEAASELVRRTLSGGPGHITRGLGEQLSGSVRPVTRRARLRFLVRQVDALADQIERSGREDDVLALADALAADPSAITPTDDAEWDALLPKEREARLVERYLTLRSELVALEREGVRHKGKNRQRWLEGPAPKFVGMAAGIGTLVHYGVQLLHAAGVMAYERSESVAGLDVPGDRDDDIV